MWQVSISAHASYVMEADGVSLSAESGDLITAGAKFDIVTRDLGIPPQDAVQIALTNLSKSACLRGNLLLWSHVPIVSNTNKNTVAAGSNEDFSYYDEVISDVSQKRKGAEGGDTVKEALPGSVETLPPLDASAIFWILKPADFESYSQMIAARFGF
jgi:hypothetical protein